ncbi:uncharacterized protein CCOS01_12056 [Colletotrichum costaricense]|uniref:Uncharacterized protein n=2 Tax=Colletotrichum acutatum species complex TaxID=2707335 RepID=A0AAI9YNX4_9PEZI|nr:uncharacterized protein CCOS01_12056 [Colletotrichum costaricense]XP_060375661.1 uncharacterized protein CTAM01_13746 [Colletotrichum tamarilloi]KAK1482032.1 hypothetical protein CTAM01_13746 [Colletotrichum tamarilloi]KAK1517799.1 hypothetical protein CCOS01_12056 [Colletotrichum costaricense]
MMPDTLTVVFHALRSLKCQPAIVLTRDTKIGLRVFVLAIAVQRPKTGTGGGL